jgi:2-iminobutanoate/2-iminopropanoate deaminase
MKTVSTNNAPAAIGPYSQAVLHNESLYISGQLGLKPGETELENSLTKQTAQILRNLELIADEVGSDFKKHAIKLTVYLTELQNFNTVNGIMEEYFFNHKPARATVEVSALPKEALIEIDAIVACKD